MGGNFRFFTRSVFHKSDHVEVEVLEQDGAYNMYSNDTKEDIRKELNETVNED